MSGDIKKERSPSSPRLSLSEAIDVVKKLHSKAGKSALRPEVAVQAIGYKGLNGAALGILSSIKQYGLVDAERAGNMSVSPLAVKLIHPLNSVQEIEARREAALKPRVFSELHANGYHACSEDVLMNHLIQTGFTPDGARKAASVFKENEEFANLSGSSMQEEMIAEPAMPLAPQHRPLTTSLDLTNVIARPSNVTKEFTFPLDEENEVELKFLGTRFDADLLNELEEVIKFLKTRFKKPKTAMQMLNEVKVGIVGAEE